MPRPQPALLAALAAAALLLPASGCYRYDARANNLTGDALGISVRTVEVHRARVFDKMNVGSAVELANLLRQAPGAG